jgi:uncharacterized protein (DUF2164 family)
MKMEHYLSQLLYRYQCVTVPGFGAFLTEIQSAQIDLENHSFFPPKKVVSFNPYVKNNDGLLANHIATAEKMSYEVAVKAIENQVAIWKDKLFMFEGIILKNVGEIIVNADKNLVFTPYHQINYLSDSFGLTSYNSPVIKREVAAVLTPELEYTEETPVLSLETETPTRSYNFLKYAAIFVVGFGVLGTLGYNYYEQQITNETLAVQLKVQKEVERKIQEATFIISNPIPSVTLTVKIKTTTLPYHVVAGAFREEKNAEKKYQRLLKLGYDARRVAANKSGLYPVLYGSYSSYSKAQKDMKTIQKTHNSEAWLWIEDL